MPVYDKNNNLIERILDRAGNEVTIPYIHAAPHIVKVKIPNLIKPADDYSIALRHDYFTGDFPSLSNKISLWSKLRSRFVSATEGYSQALADKIGYNCAPVTISGYDPKYIYIGSNFDKDSAKGCEPWYRSYTYDYTASPYITDWSRSDEQILACGRIPGDNFNPWYDSIDRDSLVDTIESQAIYNYTYHRLGINVNELSVSSRLGLLLQLDPGRRWENFGELIYGTENEILSANNEVYTSSYSNCAVAQYIMYFDADLNKYMFFNIHTLRRQSKISATTYTGVSYAASFIEYISVDVTKPFYFILDEQAYNYSLSVDRLSHSYYSNISLDFDTLIRCRIDNGDSKSTYSKDTFGYSMPYNPNGGRIYVMKVDLYKDRFLADGWKYPDNQVFVGVHPSDDKFLFNEFNVVSTENPIESYYSEQSSHIESAKTLGGTLGVSASGDYLKPFTRMWLDFEAI